MKLWSCPMILIILALSATCSQSSGTIPDYVSSSRIKVIYFYFLPRTKSVQQVEYIPQYKVIYSASWKREFGSRLDDPLMAGIMGVNPFIGDGLSDNSEQGVGTRWFANKIISLGFLDLPSTNVKKITPEYLLSISSNNSPNNTQALNFRLIWLLTDNVNKPVLLSDVINNQEMYLKFTKIEKLVDRYMASYTVQTNVR